MHPLSAVIAARYNGGTRHALSPQHHLAQGSNDAAEVIIAEARAVLLGDIQHARGHPERIAVDGRPDPRVSAGGCAGLYTRAR